MPGLASLVLPETLMQIDVKSVFKNREQKGSCVHTREVRITCG